MRNSSIPWLLVLATAGVAQSPRCTIEGRAVELDGKPLAGATIGIPGGHSTTSDADGRFAISFTGPELVGMHRFVVLAANGRVSYRMPLTTMRRGAAAKGNFADHRVDLGDVRMPPGVNFLGRVRDPAGAPLAGVRITGLDELGHHPSWHGVWGSVVTSREDGRFVLAGVFDRAVHIVFEADGYYREVVRAASIASPLDVRLEPSGFVSGPLPIVDGKPFDGWLRIQSEFLNEDLPDEPARGERYRIGVPTRGRFRVLGSRANGELGWQSDVLFGPQDDVVLHPVVARGAPMRVRAVDDDTGAEIPELRVGRVAAPRKRSGSLESTLLVELANAPSTSTASIQPLAVGEQVLVGVAASGYAPLLKTTEFVVGGEFVARLEPEASIAGEVLDAAGAPVAGCVVECVPAVWQDRVVQRTVRTGADGRFVLAGLLREPMEVRAFRSKASPSTTMACNLRARPNIEGLRLRLVEGAVVAGTVHGFDPRPGLRVLLANYRVAAPSANDWLAVANHPDPWDTSGFASAPVDADGRFRFVDCALGKTSLQLLVPAPPRGGAPVRVPLWSGTSGDGSTELVLDASAHRSAVVSGSLRVGCAAMPLGRFVVLAREVETDGGFRRSQQQIALARWQLVDDDGRFSLALPPGKHTLEVVDCVTGIPLVRREERTNLELKAGQRVQLELAFPVVEVEVRFSVPAKGRALVDHLECSFGQSIRDWESTIFGGGAYGMAGVYVEGRSETATFFAPPGHMVLSAHPVWKLAGGVAARGGERGQIEVELEAVRSQRIDMRLQPPNDLDTKPR